MVTFDVGPFKIFSYFLNQCIKPFEINTYIALALCVYALDQLALQGSLNFLLLNMLSS